MRSLLSLWLRKWPLWGISSWAVEVEKHLCQALTGSLHPRNTACISSSPKCPFHMHPALSAGQEPSYTQFTLIPYPWRSTGRAGGRRGAPERVGKGDEEERRSVRKGKREGVGAEPGESFSRGRLLCCGAEAEAHQGSVTCGLLCRELSALVVCCGTLSFSSFPFLTAGTPGCPQVSPSPALSSGSQILLPKPSTAWQAELCPLRELLPVVGAGGGRHGAFGAHPSHREREENRNICRPCLCSVQVTHGFVVFPHEGLRAGSCGVQLRSACFIAYVSVFKGTGRRWQAPACPTHNQLNLEKQVGARRGQGAASHMAGQGKRERTGDPQSRGTKLRLS